MNKKRKNASISSAEVDHVSIVYLRKLFSAQVDTLTNDNMRGFSRNVREELKISLMMVPRYPINNNNSCYVSSLLSLLLSDKVFRYYILNMEYFDSIEGNILLRLLKHMANFDTMDGGCGFTTKHNNILHEVTSRVAGNDQTGIDEFLDFIIHNLISRNYNIFSFYMYNLLTQQYLIKKIRNNSVVGQSENYLMINFFSERKGEIHSVTEGIIENYIDPLVVDGSSEENNKILLFGYSVIINVKNTVLKAKYIKNIRSSGRAENSSKKNDKKHKGVDLQASTLTGQVRSAFSISLDDSLIIRDTNSEERILRGVVVHIVTGEFTVARLHSHQNVFVIPIGNLVNGHYITFINNSEDGLFYKVDDLNKNVNTVSSVDSGKTFLDYVASQMLVLKNNNNYPVVELLLYTSSDGFETMRDKGEEGILNIYDKALRGIRNVKDARIKISNLSELKLIDCREEFDSNGDNASMITEEVCMNIILYLFCNS